MLIGDTSLMPPPPLPLFAFADAAAIRVATFDLPPPFCLSALYRLPRSLYFATDDMPITLPTALHSHCHMPLIFSLLIDTLPHYITPRH